jgi:hypothetical protein
MKSVNTIDALAITPDEHAGGGSRHARIDHKLFFLDTPRNVKIAASHKR